MYDAYEKVSRSGILTEGSGNICEGPGFNIFPVAEAKVATPPRGVLHGITREAAMLLLAEMDVPVEARLVALEELYAADEVFVTSTAGGVMPVTRIGAREVAGGTMGPMTRALVDRYWEAHTRPDWSVAVSDVPRVGAAACGHEVTKASA